MSYGISPVIPLQKSEEDGFYALTKTITQNVRVFYSVPSQGIIDSVDIL